MRPGKSLQWQIDFTDHKGRDFDWWIVNAPPGRDMKIARIIECGPFQHSVWYGTEVVIDSIRVGRRPVIRIGNEWRYLNYEVQNLHKRGIRTSASQKVT